MPLAVIMIIMGIIIMATSMIEASLYRLLSWLSPSYPVGAFSHSNGLEWAVEEGDVRTRADLEAWLEDLLQHGAGWTDAVLFIHAYRATQSGDQAGLLCVAELAAAAQPSRERHVEAMAQGAAFRRVSRAVEGAALLSFLDDVEDGALAYPIAVATASAGALIACEFALTAYLHGFVANIVSAAQRLVPLGQTDGQLAIAHLRQHVAQTAIRALALPVGDPFEQMGSASFRADMASMLHETQYTRLFRT